ncbi:hypothetical protein TNCT_34091 [Trichonephila clavata]|uniref:Uncharacterized protein n=1 Tax=Trichonephila clavata TaxID=2740835 RepID=A0A8X6LIB4_TRICU|nr:hypothetical protein TNCT_34091 [Trichonephila clavata]
MSGVPSVSKGSMAGLRVVLLCSQRNKTLTARFAKFTERARGFARETAGIARIYSKRIAPTSADTFR